MQGARGPVVVVLVFMSALVAVVDNQQQEGLPAHLLVEWGRSCLLVLVLLLLV
jgi:hypothetical protein